MKQKGTSMRILTDADIIVHNRIVRTLVGDEYPIFTYDIRIEVEDRDDESKLIREFEVRNVALCDMGKTIQNLLDKHVLLEEEE